MEGLSKEELKGKFLHYYWSTDDDRQLLTTLMSECKELNPWLPIADAPKHKGILLFYPKFKDKVVARWSHHFNCWITNFRMEINLGEPTLWQELPADPK